jgi:hypothetical protein
MDSYLYEKLDGELARYQPNYPDQIVQIRLNQKMLNDVAEFIRKLNGYDDKVEIMVFRQIPLVVDNELDDEVFKVDTMPKPKSKDNSL